MVFWICEGKMFENLCFSQYTRECVDFGARLSVPGDISYVCVRIVFLCGLIVHALKVHLKSETLCAESNRQEQPVPMCTKHGENIFFVVHVVVHPQKYGACSGEVMHSLKFCEKLCVLCSSSRCEGPGGGAEEHKGDSEQEARSEPGPRSVPHACPRLAAGRRPPGGGAAPRGRVTGTRRSSAPTG